MIPKKYLKFLNIFRGDNEDTKYFVEELDLKRLGEAILDADLKRSKHEKGQKS